MGSSRVVILLMLCAILGLATPLAAQQLPTFNRVFIVAEENTNFLSVVGNPSMPYLNGLISKYGLASQYYANTHPSIGNYFMLTTGQIITNNDGFNGIVKVDNVVRELLAAGKTWKAYEEDLPNVGYIQPDVGNYVRRHCPLSFMVDVVNSQVQRMNLVPFTRFATDLANGTLPDYSFITPNLCNDGHDCALHIIDTWLQTNIDPLIQDPQFQNGDLLVIVFDEAGSDNSHGGGRVVWVAISPRFSKLNYWSQNSYQHQSTLRLMLEGLGVTTYPGKSASADNMAEFFHQ
jgi:acid phosphatase